MHCMDAEAARIDADMVKGSKPLPNGGPVEVLQPRCARNERSTRVFMSLSQPTSPISGGQRVPRSLSRRPASRVNDRG